MSGIKSIFSSKGVWGGAIALIFTLLPLFGINIGAEDQASILGNIEGIIAAAAVLFAIYGRITAKTTLTVSGG